MSRPARAAFPVLTALLLSPIAAGAIQSINVPTLELRENETYARELAVYAESARLRGVVQDDLFIAGGNLDLGGRYANDLWAFARERLTFTGSAEDHVRLGGPAVLVEGEVARGAWLIGETVRIAPGARLKGDVWVMAQDFICLGTIDGRLSATAPKVTIGGKVGGDAEIAATDIVVQPSARFGANLLYTAPAPLNLDRKEQVTGALVRQAGPAEVPAGALWLVRIFLLAGSFAVGLAFLLLFPGVAGGAARRMRSAWWRPLTAGTAMLAVGPFAVAAGFASVIGIPVALAMLAGGGLLTLVAPVGPAVALGGLLARLRGPQSVGPAIRAFALGLLALHLLAALPGAFLPVFLAVTILGGGACLLAALEAGRGPPPPPMALHAPPDLPPAAEPPPAGGGAA